MRFANHFRDRQPQKMSYVVKSSVFNSFWSVQGNDGSTHADVMYKHHYEINYAVYRLYGCVWDWRQSFHWGKMAAHSFICEFIYIEVKFLQMPGFNTVIEIRSATAQPGLIESIDTDASGPTKVQEKLRWGEMQPLWKKHWVSLIAWDDGVWAESRERLSVDGRRRQERQLKSSGPC